jgi:hypothetical protein
MATVFALAADWSYARPNPVDVKNAGYSIALRYLGNDARCITPGERDSIYHAGLRLALIGQRGPVTQPRGGYNQGKIDGAFFQAEADELGHPDDKPILCAIADVGSGFPTPSDVPVIKEYFRGIWETNRRPIGIYGPYWILEEFRGDGRVFCYWQTAGSSGSGSGTGGSIHNEGDNSWRRLSSLACMYQEYGDVRIPNTDHNEVLMADYKRWTHHPSDTTPEEVEEEEDMAKIHIWTSSKNNREWLEHIPDYTPPSDADGGWDHPWAGLAVWEVIEGQPWIRQLMKENAELLKNLMRYQEMVGEKPTIVDDGFMETVWFQSRTWIPNDCMPDGVNIPVQKG